MTSRGMRRFLTFRYLGIWSPRSWCQTCLPCFQLVTNLVSFLRELSSRDCPPISTPICSGTISPIPSLSPWKRMNYTKEESPLLKFTPFPAPQKTSSPSTPLDHQFLAAPAVLLPLTPAAARIAGLSLLPCVIIIVRGVPRPRNAELRVPGRKTSSPARNPTSSVSSKMKKKLDVLSICFNLLKCLNEILYIFSNC